MAKRSKTGGYKHTAQSMEVNGDAEFSVNNDDDFSSHDNKKCSGMYWLRYWFVAVGFVCLLIEVIAIICTFSYKTTYDESDSDLAKVSESC